MEPVYLIPVTDTINTAWEKVKGFKRTAWAALGIFIVFMLLARIIMGLLHGFLPPLDFLLNLGYQVLTLLLQAGLIYMGLRRAFDLAVDYKMVFIGFDGQLALRLIILYILKILIIIVPMMLMMVPIIIAIAMENTITLTGVVIAGIFAAIGFALVIYVSTRLCITMSFLLMQNLTPTQSIKASWRATRENFWRLLGIFFLQFLILIASIIPLGIGLIWSIPLAMLINATIYKRIAVNAEPIDAIVPKNP